MWSLGTKAGHCVFCREDSCSGGSDPKDHCIAVWVPWPRQKISSAFCCIQLAAVDVAVFPLSRHLGSGDCPPALQWDPGFPRRSGWTREMVPCTLFCVCAAQSEQ